MKKMPSDSQFETMNLYGREAITLSEKIFHLITKKEERFEYIQSVINQRLAIG